MWRVFELLRRSSAIAILAMLLSVVTGAVAGASPPTGLRAAVGAPKEPAAATCHGNPNPSSPTTVGPAQWDDETLSGGRGDDKIISTHANPICAYQGNDLILAYQPKGGIPNDINGSAGGRDRAIVDSQDVKNLTGVELCKMSPKARKWRPCDLYTSKARALAEDSVKKDFPYTTYEAAVECRLDPYTGKRQIYFLREPWLRAVDATTQPDWQTVAYAANLNKWDGSKWVFVVQRPWLWDRTFDNLPPPPLGNFWRRFDTNQRSVVWFEPDSPGFYRISVTYHWYATKTVPEHEVTVWAGKHYGDFEVPGHESCSFPS